jgi:cyclopropane-fatty-acyl-phospholipid synthase
MLPSIRQIGEAVEGKFVMEDWNNFSAGYDKTRWHGMKILSRSGRK